MDIFCIKCGSIYPTDHLPYCCMACGSLYDYASPFRFNQAEINQTLPGIWKYHHSFGIPMETDAISLGEGNTPLVWVKTLDRDIAFKCEYLNPSGSFKDRGSVLIVAKLKSAGVCSAVEDSSGNAGASFAAYAARAGIKARVFVPDANSGPKMKQIQAYGAELVTIHGTRTQVAEAARREAEAGTVYASHAYLPFNLPGYATAAYEIYEQLGNQLPGTVIVPAGQGGFLLGLSRGFKALKATLNGNHQIPKMIGVQVNRCNPLWRLFTANVPAKRTSNVSVTVAEGVNVLNPLRGDSVVQAVKDSQGSICTVHESMILPGRDALARLGFYVEPTSAIVWPALLKMFKQLKDPIVVLLTGFGCKY